MEWYVWLEKGIIMGIVGLLFWSNKNFTKAQTDLLVKVTERLNKHDVDIAVIQTKIGDK